LLFQLPRFSSSNFEILVEDETWIARLTPQDNTLSYSQEVHAQLETILGKGMVQAQGMERVAVLA
jgi:hypothetical protein